MEEFLLPNERKNFDNFKDIFFRIKSYENNNYQQIDIDKIKEDIKNFGEDMFFIISVNLLYPNLYQIIYNYKIQSESHTNVWNNIIEKLFTIEKKIY